MRCACVVMLVVFDCFVQSFDLGKAYLAALHDEMPFTWQGIKLTAFRKSLHKSLLTDMISGVYKLRSSQSVEKLVGEKAIVSDGFLLECAHELFRQVIAHDGGSLSQGNRIVAGIRWFELLASDLVQYNAASVESVIESCIVGDLFDRGIDMVYKDRRLQMITSLVQRRAFWKTSSSSKAGSANVCNKFNSSTGCSFKNCIFKHICKVCKSADHGESKCDKSTSVTSSK